VRKTSWVFILGVGLLLITGDATAQSAPAASASSSIELWSLIVAIIAGVGSLVLGLLLQLQNAKVKNLEDAQKSETRRLEDSLKSEVQRIGDLLKNEIRRIDEMSEMRDRMLHAEVGGAVEKVNNCMTQCGHAHERFAEYDKRCGDLNIRADGWDKTLAELATDLHHLEGEHEVISSKCGRRGKG
jgi:hypothetical protein